MPVFPSDERNLEKFEYVHGFSLLCEGNAKVVMVLDREF